MIQTHLGWRASSWFSFYGMTANPVRRLARLSIERSPVRIELLRRRTSLQLLVRSSQRRNGLVERSICGGICGGLVRPVLVIVVGMGDARYRRERQQERNREKIFR